MANLETLTTIGTFSTYQTAAVVDAAEQNNNENRIANKVNTIITAISDGSVVETGKAQTFSGVQTFSAGIRVDDIQSTTGSADIIVTNGTLKLGGAATNLTAATQKFVDDQIAGAGSITLPLQFGDIQTASFNATSGFLYWVDMTSNSITVTLPGSPSNGDIIGVIDFNNTVSAGNNLIFNPNGNNLQGTAGNDTITGAPARIYLQFQTSNGWFLI